VKVEFVNLLVINDGKQNNNNVKALLDEESMEVNNSKRKTEFEQD
jgi:hypothetical protein